MTTDETGGNSEALTEDSETAVSLSELRDRAVQHTEHELITGLYIVGL